MSYTVVAPIYRGARELPELIARLRRLDGARILLVEDAGGDGAERILREAADDRVGALLLARNVGQNRALLAGLACVPGGPVVVMDGDLQDPPEAVPLLVALLDRHDAVFARRLGRHQPLVDRLTSLVFKGLLRLVFGLPAGVGAFVAMRPEVVSWLVRHQGEDPYLVGLLARSGFSLGAVPVERAPRPGGRTSYGLAGRLRLGLRVLRSLLGPAGPPRPARVRERLGWVR